MKKNVKHEDANVVDKNVDRLAPRQIADMLKDYTWGIANNEFVGKDLPPDSMKFVK